MSKVIYEPHPVSMERKAELHAQGYRIIDARFAPADAKPEPVAAPEPEPTPEPEPVVEVVEEAPKRRGRPVKPSVAPKA